jgi:hypothetical protein
MKRSTTCLLLALLASAMATPTAWAQDVPWTVKWGKFAALGLAFGSIWQASLHHQDADDAYHALERRCSLDPAACDQAPNGDYTDPISEDLYDTAVSEDNAARNWLFATEASLIGAAVLFVWELTRPKGPAVNNIPFEPVVETQEGRFGARLFF